MSIDLSRERATEIGHEGTRERPRMTGKVHDRRRVTIRLDDDQDRELDRAVEEARKTAPAWARVDRTSYLTGVIQEHLDQKRKAG